MPPSSPSSYSQYISSTPKFHLTITIFLLLLTPLYQSQYISATITPTSFIISQYTSYSFVIYRNNNPVASSFISPVSTVPSTGYIQLKLPVSYSPLTVSNVFSCTNTQSGVSLSCSVNPQTNIIKISDMFTSSTTQSAQILYITFNSIKNPSRAQNCGNFEYYIKKIDGTVIDQSPTAASNLYSTSIIFQSASFTSCSILANNNYISTRSRLSFSMVTNNPIPSDGQLIIDFPLIWDGDLQQSQTIASTLACTAISGLSSLSCTYNILQSPLNIARVTVSSLSSSGITSNTSISLDISPILTPPYTNYNTQILISSQWSDGVKIDTCTSSIVNTLPIPFRAISFNIVSGSTVIQSMFKARLDLTLSKSFSSQDQIVLLLPNNFLTNNQISLTTSSYAVFSTTIQTISANSTITKITLSNFPASPSILPANNIFTLFLNNIYNYDSTQPQTITATFYRQSESYQSSYTTYAATIGTLSGFNIASDNIVVNNIGDTLISINSQFKIKAGSTISLQYNSAINALDTAQSPISYASLNGLRISSVSYSTTLNTITVTNLFQNTLPVNSTIQFRIPTFTNPPTVKPTPYTLTITSMNGYAIASAVYTYVAALQAFVTGGTSITASSYVVMDSNVVYTVQFTTNYGFKAVTVMIPGEVTVNTGFQNTCAPNTYTSCSITPANAQGYKNLTFIGVSSAGPQSLSWSSNINPNSFKPTSSFQLYTYSQGWGIQKSTGYLTLTMTQQSNILSSQILPSSYINDAIISLKIDYILPASTPNGTVTITVPSIIDITSASCSGSNIGACTIIPPKIVILFANTDTTITHASSVVLSNVRNAPSLKPTPNFNFTLTSTDNYASLKSTIPAWTNNQLSNFTTTVSSNIGYRGQNALFTFNITGLSGKQTYINIKSNINFGALTNSTTPLAGTLINPYQVRFNIVGVATSQQSFTLQTPIYIGDYTFYLKTFTNDQFLIGESISNVWRHSCYGTQCRSCTGTSCLTCYNSSLTNFYILNTANSTCIRACSPGFYLELPSNNCIPCSTNCLQCINSSSTCTKCPIINSTILTYLNTIFNTCGQNCPPTYYSNNLTQICTPCTQPCYTCLDQYTCITCITGYYLLNISRSCVQNCPINVMVKNLVNGTCDFCNNNCLTCVNFVYNCTSCDNGNSLYLEGNTCVPVCSDQLFLKNNICTACELPCKICYNSTTTCSSCYPNSTLPLYSDYQCISISACAIGHFANLVNGSCDACPARCRQCVSLTNCTTCATGFYLYANDCVVTCPNITFANDNALTCDSCVGCVTCSSSTVCTSCRSSDHLYLAQCLPLCPSSTYSNTQVVNSTSRLICTPCPISCPTCINSTYCLSCINEKYLYQGICNTICPISTYPSTPRCISCPVTCKTCTSATNCLTCSSNYSLQNNTCVLTCSLGISFNQTCYPCGLNCALCQITTCTRCAFPYLLLNNICMEICPSNTLTLDNMTCTSCTTKFVNCSTCNQTHCLSCTDGQLSSTGQCLPCIPGTYSHNSQCVNCPSVCSICLNSYVCTACTTGYYFQSNFCVQNCPNNKIPNGTKCDICMPNCTVCNLVTTLCLVCNAGMYQYQGYCVTGCPDPYVTNLNYTLCVTKEQYAQEYSKASKPIYFPFTIAAFVFIIVGIILNCCNKNMHLRTFLVATIGWIQLASWVLFGAIQYVFYKNLQQNAVKGIILVLAAVIVLVICNWIFLRFYFKYFKDDVDFIKWQRNHTCINTIFVFFGTLLTFKGHRILYSRIMQRQQLSMVLSSSKKLLPISILSVISIIFSQSLVIVGSAFALYYSLNLDQQFFNALDTLIITGIMVLLMLLDLKHSHNYFIDQHQTQNIRNKMYMEDYQEFSINGNNNKEKIKDRNNKQLGIDDLQAGSNISRQNLIQAANNANTYDGMQTAKKVRVQAGGNRNKINLQQEDQFGQTIRQGVFGKIVKQNLQGSSSLVVDTDNLNNNNSNLKNNNNNQSQYLQQQQQQNEPNSTLSKPLWIQKQYDHYGYLIKSDPITGNPQKYDKNGNRIQIDQNGIHHAYDQNGYQVKTNPRTGLLSKYDKQGYIVRQDGTKEDARGYRVEKLGGVDQDGNGNGKEILRFYDQNGYQVVVDQETGEEVKLDSKGNIVKIDPLTKQHKFYTKQGYQVLYPTQQNSITLYRNPQSNNYIKFNKNTKKWQQYDPRDNFLLIKNQKTGKYQKYDQQGFRIQYDQYGNIYRYDHEGLRVIIGLDGEIRRYDSQGYQVKRDLKTGERRRYDQDGYQVRTDSVTGNKVLYDKHGYRVQKDFYNKPTLYDQQNNIIIIDPLTQKHHKFTKQGLEIITDQKTGQKYLKDKRGRKVIQLEDGYYQKYDQEGNKIWLDDQGYEVVTDQDGNIARYDKIGDLVEDEEEEYVQERGKNAGGNGNGNEGWEIQEDQGDNMMVLDRKNDKKQKRNKFSTNKQYNFEQQYSKMVKQQQKNKPHLLFNLQDDQLQQNDDNLRQFHDVQPVNQYELQKQYQTLYNIQAERQHFKRQNSQGRMKINLSQLQQIDNTPYNNLRQKIRKNRNKMTKQQLQNSSQFGTQKQQIMMQPQQNQQKLQLKSVADASINQRSFINQGVQPLTDQSRNTDQLQMESLEQIDAVNMNNVNLNRNKNKKDRRSQANFNKNKNISNSDNNKDGRNVKNNDTQSQKNYMQSNSSRLRNQNNNKNSDIRKIYDSDQQVQSLGQQQWQNQGADIFYKDHPNTNANTNSHNDNNNGGLDQQSDILSDYIPQPSKQQQSSHYKDHKGSEQNILHKKYMQSIEEVQDQLFDKLKSQDFNHNNNYHKVKRTDFKLSGTPNPLVQYAKTIDAKKMGELVDRGQRYRYKERGKKGEDKSGHASGR